MSNEANKEFVNDIQELMNKTSGKIELYLKSIKEESVNEILNGSITKAKEILETILPVQNAAENLMNAKEEFFAAVKIQNLQQTNQSGKTELRVLNTTKNIPLKQSGGEKLFRASILKALIYLGGNAELKSVTEFVKRESIKTGIVHEKEIQIFDDEEKLLKIVMEESFRMLKEGLVIEDNLSKKWEILPAGIDFLSRHDISIKSKAN
ncbi:MAG: hypothetical protein CO129_08475 [Ignavibacteriales bacterium CG_4_9_14_3_um_filter_34_10]|nr:MAG: hypothetical protein CO129_08475 [Ignavibacteriales bacterium CG_4_9_14_3_um_filter_34_10]